MTARVSGGETTIRLLAVVACIAVLGGCGGSSERDRVRGYIEAVNTIHDEASPALARANASYERFAKGKLKAADAEAAMARNKLAILTLRDRVQQLEAPARARRLKRLILAEFDANVGMAEQTRLLARYVPAQTKALAGGQTLGRELQRRLRAATADPAAQSAALGHYAEGLKRVTAKVLTLKPPIILVPARDAQLRRLRASRDIALKLRAAVGRRDQALVVALLQQFQTVNQRGPDKALTDAAYRAYLDYIDALRGTETRVNAEVSRLDRALA
jgi:hypothetical protein